MAAASTFWRQLRVMLWKNWLLKKRDLKGTAMEVLLPVGFMLLLVLFKNLSTLDKEPNEAYVCDNNCNDLPDTCTIEDYSVDAYWSQNVGVNTDNPWASPDMDRILQSLNNGGDANYIMVVAPQVASDAYATACSDFVTYIDTQWGTSSGVSVTDVVKVFTDELALQTYVKDDDYDDEDYGYGKVMAAIIFEGMGDADSNNNWEYSIRLNYTYDFGDDDRDKACFTYSCNNVPATNVKSDDLTVGLNTDYVYGYGASGFLTLQQLVEGYVLGDTTESVRVSLYPIQQYEHDNFVDVMKSVLGLFYMLSYLYPVSRLIKSIMHEKETKIKEGMRMMGLKESVFYLSWFISAGIQYTLTALVITLVTANNVFQYSDKFFVFVYFVFFGLDIIALCFLVSSFFDRAKTAASAGTMLFFASFFPYMALDSDSYGTSTKAMTALLAPSCFGFGISNFAEYEGGQVGVTVNNLTSSEAQFSYILAITMMAVDFGLYAFLAWYFDKVLPHEFGAQLPPYFLFTSAYWTGRRASKGTTDSSLLENDSLSEPVDAEDAQRLRGKLEAVPDELLVQERERRCIKINKLRKVFDANGVEKVAVNRLNLSMYEGQITVLLGHNGAGKSTTISMLTGLIAPSGGDAMVCGMKISEQMPEVRDSLGVCPQHDILFPQLTVNEHLRLFAVFKGVPDDKVDEAVEAMVGEVGLREKRHIMSSMLSGGMKRKLSVGIALIGDSKVVILDEPTSGMDPYSRRSTWSVLQKSKKGRIILLTTHFMDEADILGDRIAIMAEGELRCAGSSLFLKNVYGVGYTLTIVMNSGGDGTSTPAQAAAAIKCRKATADTVRRYVPSATPLSDVGAELQFRLPMAAAGAFRDMFQKLDEQSTKLDIATYSISVTSLEEVFIRVARGVEDTEQRQHLKDISSSRSSGNLLPSRVSSTGAGGMPQSRGSLQISDDKSIGGGSQHDVPVATVIDPDGDMAGAAFNDSSGVAKEFKVFMVHLRALLTKRLIYAKRDKKTLYFQLVYPILILCGGLSLLLLRPSLDLPDLEITVNAMDLNSGKSETHRNYVPFYAATATGEEVMAKFDGTLVPGEAVALLDDDGNFAYDFRDEFYGCASGPAGLVNISDFLLGDNEGINAQKRNEGGASRYGAIEFPDTGSPYTFAIMVNTSAVHGYPLYINQVHNALYQISSGDSAANILLHNHPLPRTARQDRESQAADSFTGSLMVMIAFSFIPASFAIFVVKEREVKAKHQQVISGVSLYAYWVSTFIWDSVAYLVPAFAAIILFFIFGLDAYTHGAPLGATILLFVLFGPAAAGFTYCLSFAFKSHSEAQNVILFLNFVTGLILTITSFVLALFSSTKSINSTLKWVLFRLFPVFNLSDGLLMLASCTDEGKCYNTDGHLVHAFDWNVAGANILYLGLSSIIYFFIAVGIEFALATPAIAAALGQLTVSDPGFVEEPQDDDVATEAERVHQGHSEGDVIVLNRIRKVYPSVLGPKVAVKQLTFGVHHGECFGFLGINGAGKTTSMSILSGEFPATSGSATIAGFDVATEQLQLRRRIGYCPQFDALLDLLTVQEHLELYARIKGVPSYALNRVVDAKIEGMDLSAFRHKTAGSLSGGNKRKLSVAVAMIGSPTIVFLDEPSTGMDPVARRFMWEVIAEMCRGDETRDGCSVMLTTHSMEEAEALCSRIAIMVDGGLRCLGSAPHLKNKFGEGYELDIKTEVPTIDLLRPLLAVAAPVALGSAANLGEDAAMAANVASSLVRQVCQALGDDSRYLMIRDDGPGALINQMLHQDGVVPLRTLLEFWVCEDHARTLEGFMKQHFDGAQCVEHASSTSFRYKVPRHAGTDRELNLSLVFGVMEDAKQQLSISEYSIGQTTLEQIFNHFASSSANPEVAKDMAERASIRRSSSNVLEGAEDYHAFSNNAPEQA